MKTFSPLSIIEPAAASSRRQPVRQTRTNPARTVTNLARPAGGRGSIEGPLSNGQSTNGAPGFFPAITHFTDSIAALPKEMVRHYTMLKEVDAKIYGPEEVLGQLVTAARKAPIPPRTIAPLEQAKDDSILYTDAAHSVSGSTAEEAPAVGAPQGEAASQPEERTNHDRTDLSRRKLFYNLRMVMGEMLMTLDEKNHVMSTAVEGLDKQLARCESSYPHIENEISEEARYGSLNHWAYTDKTAEKKGTTAGERTRREAAAAHNLAAAAAAMHEGDAALRSEARREAIAARKQRNHHIDSDFDDGRTGTQPAAKRIQNSGKGRKAVEISGTANGVILGLGISNGAPSVVPTAPNKRRRIEKPNPGTSHNVLLLEKSMSTVFGTNGTGSQGKASSPHEIPAVEATKKRARGAGAAIAVNGNGRRRTNTNTSAVNTPSLVSSPVVGTFAVSKIIGRSSPGPAAMQRVPSSRARQNSTQSALPDTRRRPSSSTSNKPTNGNGVIADIGKIVGITNKSVESIKNTTKEIPYPKGENHTVDTTNGDGTPKAAHLPNPKSNDKTLKREDTDQATSKTRADRPPSISTSTRTAGKLSKTSTPITTSFSEPARRSRPSRTLEPTAKRSHKKGAGLAAQLAAAAAADEESESLAGEEEEEDDDEEPRYCSCNGVSHGEMIACEMESCPIEWFHYGCVGLKKPPPPEVPWYCDDCKQILVKKAKVARAK